MSSYPGYQDFEPFPHEQNTSPTLNDFHPSYNDQQLFDTADYYHNLARSVAPMGRARNGASGRIDSKPRLQKHDVDILEAHYQENHKPTTALKRLIAEQLMVDVPRVNNWFQNRRARAKQEEKQMNYDLENGHTQGFNSSQSNSAEGFQAPDMYDDQFMATQDHGHMTAHSLASGMRAPPVASVNPQYNDPTAASISSLHRTMAEAEAAARRGQFAGEFAQMGMSGDQFGGPLLRGPPLSDRAQFPSHNMSNTDMLNTTGFSVPEPIPDTSNGYFNELDSLLGNFQPSPVDPNAQDPNVNFHSPTTDSFGAPYFPGPAFHAVQNNFDVHNTPTSLHNPGLRGPAFTTRLNTKDLRPIDFEDLGFPSDSTLAAEESNDVPTSTNKDLDLNDLQVIFAQSAAGHMQNFPILNLPIRSSTDEDNEKPMFKVPAYSPQFNNAVMPAPAQDTLRFKSPPGSAGLAGRRSRAGPEKISPEALRRKSSLGPQTASLVEALKRPLKSPAEVHRPGSAGPVFRRGSAGNLTRPVSSGTIGGRIQKPNAAMNARNQYQKHYPNDGAKYLDQMKKHNQQVFMQPPFLGAAPPTPNGSPPEDRASPQEQEDMGRSVTSPDAEAQPSTYVYNQGVKGFFTSPAIGMNVASPPETPLNLQLGQAWGWDMADESLQTPGTNGFTPEMSFSNSTQPHYVSRSSTASQPATPVAAGYFDHYSPSFNVLAADQQFPTEYRRSSLSQVSARSSPAPPKQQSGFQFTFHVATPEEFAAKDAAIAAKTVSAPRK